MTVYCTGTSGSGTRMLYDMVNALGVSAVHATVPGYYDKPEGGLDTEHPNWWTVEEWEARYGPGRWIHIVRDEASTRKSAVSRGFVSNKDYAAYRKRGLDIIAAVPDPLVVAYATIVAHPQETYDAIADWLGVPHQQVGVIYDGDAKYRKGRRQASG